MNHGIAALLTLCLIGCTQVLTPVARTDYAISLAQQKGWKPEDIATDDFVLRSYVPIVAEKSETLTVYIEGDGLAWISSSMPSSDPTPQNPIALKLALRDTTPSAYLARPCQFIDKAQQSHCAQKYWTSHRFSPEVIRATNQAIEHLKLQRNAEKLILVGYSGGGAVALLVATRRQDVKHIITIAGNLNPSAWVDEHHLSPLSGSLNPADEWQQLQHIPQTHFVGEKDHVVGASVASAYAARFPVNHQPKLVVFSNFDHHCCWESRWPELKHQAIPE